MSVIKKLGIVNLVICLVLVATLVAGCGTKQEAEAPSTPTTPAPTAPSKVEQVLLMGSQKDFKGTGEGKLLVLETLAGLDEHGNLVPKLAESWDTSEDGKECTLHLRKGVKFHDGTSFNAKTVKFALERVMRHSVWAKYVDKIEVSDDYTVKVVFNTYYYPFLMELASGWNVEDFVSPTGVEPAWDVNGKLVNYIGTGPFKLIDYKKDQEAVLVRNDDYWGKKPKLEKILWKVTPDPYAQILALKAGELHIIGAPEHHSSVPFMKLAELERDPALVVMTHSYGRYQVFEFNCKRPPFDDVRVRKAFNYAINREEMVTSLFGDITEPVYLITDPKFKWGPSNIEEGYKYDPGETQRLLAEAGWADTNGDGFLEKDGKPFECELVVPTGEANADMVSLIVQSELRKIGIKLGIIMLESGAAGERRKTEEYDLYLHHSGCLPSIPGGIAIGGKYHSSGWPFSYHSSELDELIEKAFTTPDEAQRRVLINQIWPKLHDAYPCIPLYDVTKAVVLRKNVKGFKHGPTMVDMDLSDVEITQ